MNGFTQPNSLDNPTPSVMTIHSPALPIQNLVAVARSWVGAPDYLEADTPIPVDITFDNSIHLREITISPSIDDIQTGDLLTIQLYWDIITAPQHNAIVYLHIKDRSDTLIAQQDREPLSDFRMDTWQAGQQIMTTHQIQLPTVATPNSLSLGMYRFDDSGAIVPLKMSEDAAFQIDFVAD